MNPKHIIIHNSATRDSGAASWGAIRRYHLSRGWDDIGYHVGVELIIDQWEVLFGRMPDIQGAHCRAQGMNSISIGICAVGNFDVVAPPEEQWNLVLKVTQYFRRVYDIPIFKISGHREFDPGKTCPGRLWDMEKFRSDLGNY